MNKSKLLPYLLALLFIAVLPGCGDDDDKEPTRTALLTAQTWQANRIFVSGREITNDVDEADLNNTTIKFNTNGTYDFSLLGDAFTGTWEFTSNEQKIILDKGSSDETTIDILELTGTTLNLQFMFEDNGVPFPVEIRFVKQ